MILLTITELANIMSPLLPFATWRFFPYYIESTLALHLHGQPFG